MWSFHWSMWICILLCSVVLKYINNRSKKDKIGDTHWYKSELCWCWCKMWMFKTSMHTSFLCCFLLIFFLTYSAGLRWNFWKLSVWNNMITAFPVSEYVIGSLGHVFSSGKLYFFGQLLKLEASISFNFVAPRLLKSYCICTLMLVILFYSIMYDLTLA